MEEWDNLKPGEEFTVHEIRVGKTVLSVSIRLKPGDRFRTTLAHKQQDRPDK